jgi:flagellar FliL protein
LGEVAAAMVSVIVYNTMNADSVTETRVDISENYSTRPPIMDWYDGLGEVRSQTQDSPPRSIIIDVQLGYTQGDTVLNSELTEKRPQIIDLVRRYLAQRSNDELRNEELLKLGIKEKINKILRNGQIEEVIFHQFQTFEF